MPSWTEYKNTAKERGALAMEFFCGRIYTRSRSGYHASASA